MVTVIQVFEEMPRLTAICLFPPSLSNARGLPMGGKELLLTHLLSLFVSRFIGVNTSCPNPLTAFIFSSHFQKYVNDDPSGRDPSKVNMTVVKQGCEPLSFTGWFPVWSNEKWRHGKTFEDLKKELGGNFDGTSSVAEVNSLRYFLSFLCSTNLWLPEAGSY